MANVKCPSCGTVWNVKNPSAAKKPAATTAALPDVAKLGFFRHQRLIALRHRGRLNPEEIDEYIALGGYSALPKALFDMEPSEIVEEVKTSGLRGRGGAGFPTGIKWELARNAESASGRKFIVCNAHEGAPGGFMDWSLLEADPHAASDGQARYSRAVRVISGWLHDARFHGASGKPAILPMDGGENSFALLVKEYSGDIPTRAMLTMLEEGGTVAVSRADCHEMPPKQSASCNQTR